MTSRQKKGIIIIAFGLIMLLNETTFLSFNLWGIIWKYWPLYLIYKALEGFYEQNNWTSGNSILLGFGILLLGKNLGFLNFFKFSYIWPLIIVVVGYNMLQSKGANRVNSGNDFSATAIFSGVEIKNTSKEFSNASILSLFGGCEVDLKSANMTSGSTSQIDTTVLFGGAEIVIPKHWNVEVKGIPLFGGISDETYFNEENDKKLIINAFVMFGGLDIKN